MSNQDHCERKQIQLVCSQNELDIEENINPIQKKLQQQKERDKIAYDKDKEQWVKNLLLQRQSRAKLVIEDVSKTRPLNSLSSANNSYDSSSYLFPNYEKVIGFPLFDEVRGEDQFWKQISNKVLDLGKEPLPNASLVKPVKDEQSPQQDYNIESLIHSYESIPSVGIQNIIHNELQSLRIEHPSHENSNCQQIVQQQSSFYNQKEERSVISIIKERKLLDEALSSDYLSSSFKKQKKKRRLQLSSISNETKAALFSEQACNQIQIISRERGLQKIDIDKLMVIIETNDEQSPSYAPQIRNELNSHFSSPNGKSKRRRSEHTLDMINSKNRKNELIQLESFLNEREGNSHSHNNYNNSSIDSKFSIKTRSFKTPRSHERKTLQQPIIQISRRKSCHCSECGDLTSKQKDNYLFPKESEKLHLSMNSPVVKAHHGNNSPRNFHKGHHSPRDLHKNFTLPLTNQSCFANLQSDNQNISYSNIPSQRDAAYHASAISSVPIIQPCPTTYAIFQRNKQQEHRKLSILQIQQQQQQFINIQTEQVLSQPSIHQQQHNAIANQPHSSSSSNEQIKLQMQYCQEESPHLSPSLSSRNQIGNSSIPSDRRHLHFSATSDNFNEQNSQRNFARYHPNKTFLIRMEMRREKTQKSDNHLVPLSPSGHHKSHSLPKKQSPIILTSLLSSRIFQSPPHPLTGRNKESLKEIYNNLMERKQILKETGKAFTLNSTKKFIFESKNQSHKTPLKKICEPKSQIDVYLQKQKCSSSQSKEKDIEKLKMSLQISLNTKIKEKREQKQTFFEEIGFSRRVSSVTQSTLGSSSGFINDKGSMYKQVDFINDRIKS